MVLYRRMALALLAVGLVACGEGEGESDAVATDTSNNIGSYSLYIPQALSALPGSPVALGSTDVRSDYGIGTIDIDLYTSSADSASSTRTSGSANNIQLQPLSHLDALSVGTGTLAVSDAFWKNGWNAQGVGVTVIDDFKTQLTNQSPSLVTGPVTINRVKTDTTGGTATASYEQFFRHTPRPSHTGIPWG